MFNLFRKSKRSAFTLIELLVVISIIALLAAILFPTFARVREMGRRTACQSNLKQMAMGISMYVSDYDDRYIDYRTMSVDSPWPLMYDPYVKNKQVLLCPDASDTSAITPNLYGTVGTASKPWTGYRYFGSYGYNSWLYCGARANSACQLGQVDSPATTLLLCDSIWVDGWVYNGDTSCPASYNTQTGANNSNNMGRICIDRHSGGINVAFVDGHVKWSKLENLSKITYQPLAP